MTQTDSHQGKTVWEAQRAKPPVINKLSKDISTEVLIIGAGISGALVAEQLTADGREVTLVDRRLPGTGATAASTALLLFEIDTPLTVLSEQIGKERASRAWRRSSDSMRRLTEKVRVLELDCNYAERESVLLPGNVLAPRGLRHECEARQALKLPSRIAERDELLSKFGIDRPCAIISGNSAETDPVKLALGFLDISVQRGAKILAPEEVVAIAADERRAIAKTKSGHRITAQFVVFCGGFELPDFIPSKGHRIVSTWAAATRIQPENLWPSRALIWEAADPYLYMRTTKDGRVLAGGEDEAHNDEDRRASRIPSKLDRFRSQLRLLMPKIDFDVEFAWAGAFGKSETGLPTIGSVPGMPRVCAVLGFGGNGTTYAQVAAEMISRALRGEDEPDIDLFAFASHQ